MNKPTEKTLNIYAWQIITFVAASIFSLAILLTGYDYYSSAQLKVDSALMRQKNLYSDIDKLTENKMYLETSSNDFYRIQVLGFFSSEDRLSWGEALNGLAINLKFPSLKYSIRPQEVVANVGPGFSPSLKLSKSIMDIDAYLLHEGDFLTLSNQLSQLPGLFRVNECELLKNTEIVVSQPHKNINLKCSLGWYTAQYQVVDDSMYEEDIEGVDII